MYASEVNEEVLRFRVMGVWRRNMVIRDETSKSIWQHATGECIYGPMKGRTLEPIGGELISWGGWKKLYPHTTLAVLPENPPHGLLPDDKMYSLFRLTEHFAAPAIRARGDNRLRLHEEVIGVIVNGKARAYPVSLLKKTPHLEDRLGGEPITLITDLDGDHVRVYHGHDGAQGEPIRLSRQRYLGWSEFYPETEIFSG